VRGKVVHCVVLDDLRFPSGIEFIVQNFLCEKSVQKMRTIRSVKILPKKKKRKKTSSTLNEGRKSEKGKMGKRKDSHWKQLPSARTVSETSVPGMVNEIKKIGGKGVSRNK
jgi:hypothetical protein